MITAIYKKCVPKMDVEMLTKAQAEFRDVVNRLGIDDKMNIQDLVLAKYLTDSLDMLAMTIHRRDKLLSRESEG